MKRFEFPAEVWTHAETVEQAIDQVRDLVGVVVHSDCGIAVDHEPSSVEEVDE